MRLLNIFKSLFIFKKPLAFFISFIFLQQISAQVKLDGYVRDSDGRLLPGINILSEPAGDAAETDQQGYFQINLGKSQKIQRLIFSGIGYRSYSLYLRSDSVLQSPLNIQMLVDVLKLDEVVVTGNAINTTKKKLGNSISTIQGTDVKYAGTNHLSGLLNGRIMGGVVVQNSGDPGGGFSLKLRGVGSVFGSSEPLYLVDGVIVDNSSTNMVNLNLPFNTRYQTGNNRLVDINPHDVDHIEVINGPAAAATYGSRAANGVVQIFTKKGKKGKPEVVYSGSVNYNSIVNRIDVNEYPFRFGIQKGLRLDSASDRRTMVTNSRTDQTVNPGGGPKVYSGYLDTSKYPVTRYDYQEKILQPSWGTDQHISVSGAGDKGSYYMSGSYLDNAGIMVGTGFKRYGVKLNSSYEVNDWIKISGGLNYANSKSTELPNSFLQFAPLSAMNHTDNVYNIDERDSLGRLRPVENGWVNPLTPVETFKLTTETNRTIANLSVNLSPWKGFVFNGTVGLDNFTQVGNAYQARIPYTVPLGLFSDGYVSTSNQNYQQWTTDLTASYSKTLGNEFSSATVAGFNSQYLRNAYNAQQGRDLLSFGNTLQAAQNIYSTVDRKSEQVIYGYFLQETLGYKDYLFLTLAGRFDASSAFGKDAGTIFYPKAGLAFGLSEMDFWDKGNFNQWFNSLHLRASFGKAGNLTGIGPYDRFTTLAPIVYYNNVGGFAPQNRMGNERIRPEVKTEIEGGADMEFLKGRLYSKMTFYFQRINDIVIPYEWAPSNGYYSILDNLGTMENKGFEFMAGGYPVKSKDFSWEISFLFNKNKNKVTSLYQNTPYVGFENNNQGAVVGYPVGVYYGTYYARNPDGTLLLNPVYAKDSSKVFLLPQVERGDPVLNEPARVKGQPDGTPINKVLGDPNPDYTAHLVNEIRYKQWKLRIQVDRVAGYEMFNWTKIIRNNIGNGKMAEKELKGELTRGWVAAVGGFVNGPVIWEEAVEDASFTKIRELSLSFQLNRLKGIKGMEFVLTGRNLFTFTKYDGADPETSTAGQSIVRGTDYGSYPVPRVIQFTIITTF
jgi:TonB-linked SusC/RagA family outer membrane protein